VAARTWIHLAVGIALALAGLLLDPHWLKAALDARAADGRTDFFSLEVVSGLRWALVLAGPCVALWPALARVLARAPRAEPAGGRGAPLVETLLVAALLLCGLARIRSGPPLTKDTRFYLGESLDMAEHGGLAALPGRLLRGEHTDANRHPLYPGLLSLAAEESDRFVERARLLSLLGGAAALVALVRLCRRAWGEGGAALSGALLVTNGAFLEASVTVGCESWWMACAILWFDLLTREEQGRPLRRAAAAGACVGLAYLFKGTASLLLVLTVAHLALTLRRRALASLGAALGAFALVALPLLWRNATVFGNPLYNVNSSRVFWLDEWREFYDPAAMSAAGPLSYLADHSALDVVARLAAGAVKQGVNLLEDLAPLAPHAGLGLPLLVLVAACALRDPSRRRRGLLAALFALFFAVFAWYAQVVSGARFLAVIVPLLFVPVAALWPRLFGPRRARACAGTVALVVAAWAVADGALAWRPGRFRPAPGAEVVRAYLATVAGLDGDQVHYLLGPNDDLTFDWDRDLRGTRHPFPPTRAGLERLLASRDGALIRYALVRDPARSPRQGAGATWFAAPPAGWTPLERLEVGDEEVRVLRRD